jgi:hypothetical protein
VPPPLTGDEAAVEVGVAGPLLLGPAEPPPPYPALAELQRRVTANQGNRKCAGRIAVARQLLVSIYHMLKHQQPFRPERIGKAVAHAQRQAA